MAEVEKYIGSKIRISTHIDQGTYEGIIHTIDKDARKIILNQVKCSDGTVLASHQVFYADDIKTLVLLEELKKKPQRQHKGRSNKNRSNNEHDSPNEPEKEELYDPINAKNDNPKQDISDEGPRFMDRPYLDPLGYLAGDYVQDSTPMFCIKREPRTMLIDSFGEDFDTAVDTITRHRVIGVSSEGTNLCRFGTLSLLVVGCVETIYVFDIIQLGKTCFEENRLRHVLESSDILKVMHDCRKLSDYLYHNHQVALNNVFDTQVADVIVYKQTRGELPRQLNGLLSALNDYLHVFADREKFQRLWSKHSQCANADWSKRPLDQQVIEAAAEQVLYLRELRSVLIERMLMEFLHGVDLYLGHMRDAPDKTIKNTTCLRLPRGFHELGRLKENRRNRYRRDDKQKREKSRLFINDMSNESGGDEAGKKRGNWVRTDDFWNAHSKLYGRVVEVIDDKDGYHGQNAERNSDNEYSQGRIKQGLTESPENVLFEDSDDAPNFSASTTQKAYLSAKLASTLPDSDLLRSSDSSRCSTPSQIPSPLINQVDSDQFRDSDNGKSLRKAQRNITPRTFRRASPGLYLEEGSIVNNGSANGDKRSSLDPHDINVKHLQNHGSSNNLNPPHIDGANTPQSDDGLLLDSNKTFEGFKPGDFPPLDRSSEFGFGTEEPLGQSNSEKVASGKTTPTMDIRVGLSRVTHMTGRVKSGVGRARLRNHYIENPVPIPIGSEPRRSSFGRNAVPFPSDSELLRTPLVAEAAGPVHGDRVKIKRVQDD